MSLRAGVGTIAAVLVAGIALSAAPVWARDDARAPRSGPAPAAAPSVVATALGPTVEVYDAPGAAKPSRTLTNPTKTDGTLVFLVDRAVDGGWLEVLLPVRPNGSTGWIRTDAVSLATNPYRIVVRLHSHRLTVFHGDQVVVKAPVGVGTSSTPTPGGRYFLMQLFAPPDPNGPYGPHAYALSGFSEVLRTFEGGDAIIGIHGTNRPDLVGQDVSHGCIRVRNEVIEQLAPLLPLGTPVKIQAR